MTWVIVPILLVGVAVVLVAMFSLSPPAVIAERPRKHRRCRTWMADSRLRLLAMTTPSDYSASAPEMISISSLVMTAWRVRL